MAMGATDGELAARGFFLDQRLRRPGPRNFWKSNGGVERHVEQCVRRRERLGRRR